MRIIEWIKNKCKKEEQWPKTGRFGSQEWPAPDSVKEEIAREVLISSEIASGKRCKKGCLTCEVRPGRSSKYVRWLCSKHVKQDLTRKKLKKEKIPGKPSKESKICLRSQVVRR